MGGTAIQTWSNTCACNAVDRHTDTLTHAKINQTDSFERQLEKFNKKTKKRKKYRDENKYFKTKEKINTKNRFKNKQKGS